ncbi:MAG TPA: xanthine dehydrogenase family protein molybdopterin-binding subunit [Gaiellaceae bacterium]|nr:xanthine dehydrogenase family protein molybdopterin-binding subunit [Gaiellaceae bacterium]
MRGVDPSAARELPGVVDVITAADVPDARIPIRLPFAETPRSQLALQPLLARDRVRYVGEPVAVVVAEDAYVAEDAAELVVLDLEELDPVADVRAAVPAAPLHDDLGGNVVDTFPLAYGDIESAFAAAAVVVRETLRMPRDAATPLETRGVLAEVDEAGRLVVWGAAKVKHFNRDVLARLLELPPERILLIEGNVGGGFGARGEFYPEDFLVPFLAVRLGRPVKWIEDRREHFIATNHSREQEHEFELAVGAGGELLAFRDRLSVDLGAYVRTQGVLLPLITMQQLVGPYVWHAFELEASAVLTNKTPAGTFRAPGVTEATFVRERMIDRAAAELGLDPAELRRRNLVPAERMPFVYELPPGPPVVYESGDFPATLSAALERGGYDELRAQQRAARAEGRLLGIGLAAFTEMGGIGPWEHARIVPLEDGRFRVECGVASLGQGVQTVLAQIAGDQLAVPFEAVVVDHADTDTVPMGFGAFASRSTVLAGNAIALAARNLREQAGEGTLDAARLAAAGVVGEGRFEKAAPSFSCGANLSVVELDPETGLVRVVKHVVAFDVGRSVNPTLVHGQLAGGAAQGIAAALWEELPYDEGAQPLATSFLEYALPTAQDLPPIDVVVLEFPTPGNPLGLKGAGEAGVAGAPAAVANAVADALGERGREVTELPLSPARVRALLG